MFKQHYIFFTHTYFQKIQTTLLEQYYQTTPSQTKTVIYQLEKITVPFRFVMLFFPLPSVSSFYHHLWTGEFELIHYLCRAQGHSICVFLEARYFDSICTNSFVFRNQLCAFSHIATSNFLILN